MNALSNTGQIAGSVYDYSTGDSTACRYDLNTRKLVDLDATVGKAAGWHFSRAVSINDAGQILGNGEHNGKQRSFLLTPLP